MARFGRWFIALTMLVSLAGLVPQANAQIVIRTGPRHRRWHHHRHYHHRHGYYR